MAITYPPILINEYLAEKVPQRLPGRFNGQFRFFPTLPTDINALVKQFPAQANDVFGVYDRMFRLNRQPFPHVKCEQMMLYLYKMNSDPEALIETVQVIHDLLDRKDESAQEVNAWISSKTNSAGLVTFGTGRMQKTFKPVFFHEMNIFSLEEARDIVAQQTGRTFAASKIIVNYDYHVHNYS
jgi:hypothetical protein